MITQAQAQAHAKACGLSGRALPIVAVQRNLRYTLAERVCEPERMEELAYAGDVVSGHTLLCWRDCYGIDYVTIV